MIQLSLNETEMLAQKAARGAGLAWGLAQDAGRAARWLAPRSTHWADSLLGILDRLPAAAHCPFLLGGFVEDSATLPRDYVFRGIAWPIWLLPALQSAAILGGHCVAVRLGLMDVLCSPESGATATAPCSTLEALEAADVHIQTPAPDTTALPCALAVVRARPVAEPARLARLEAYAARTYVPATEESRRKGAGAGLRDED